MSVISILQEEKVLEVGSRTVCISLILLNLKILGISLSIPFTKVDYHCPHPPAATTSLFSVFTSVFFFNECIFNVYFVLQNK